MQNDQHERRAAVAGIAAALMGRPADALSPDIDLNRQGLDSLGMVRFVMALEERFGVVFPEESFSGGAFDSIAAAERTVSALLARERLS